MFKSQLITLRILIYFPLVFLGTGTSLGSVTVRPTEAVNPSQASSPIFAKAISHLQEQESAVNQEIRTWKTSIQKVGAEKTKLFKKLECLHYILNITDDPESIKIAQEKCALYERVSEHMEKYIK